MKDCLIGVLLSFSLFALCSFSVGAPGPRPNLAEDCFINLLLCPYVTIFNIVLPNGVIFILTTFYST